MRVYKIYPVGFAANSYIVTEDCKTCIVIDPSQPRVAEKCAELGLECKYVLLTHGHYDHIGGCGAFFEKGAVVCCGEREKDGIFGEINDGLATLSEIPAFSVGKTFADGQTEKLCGLEVKVIFTPGHTAGSVSYLIGDSLFTGDTLFCGSVGRCDLPTGNAADLIKSVKKLYALDGDFKVYCGHEEDTTLDFERKNNAYIRQ